MASYKLLIKPSAVRELESLAVQDRRRIVERILALSSQPRPAGCEKLSRRNAYRVRQGTFRIVYTVDDRLREVTVFRVGHRRDVYR